MREAGERERQRRQGGDGRAGSRRSGEEEKGGPSGCETAARVSELDAGEESGSVIKCARAATQAGGRPARGFAARSPAANAGESGGRGRAAD